MSEAGARSRLDLVLAAGMAHVALVPTDAPKRGSEDLLAVVVDPAAAPAPDQDEEYTAEELEKFLASLTEGELETPELFDARALEKAVADAAIHKTAEETMNEFVDELLLLEEQMRLEGWEMEIDDIRRQIALITDTVAKFYPREDADKLRKYALNYRMKGTNREINKLSDRTPRSGRRTKSESPVMPNRPPSRGMHRLDDQVQQPLVVGGKHGMQVEFKPGHPSTTELYPSWVVRVLPPTPPILIPENLSVAKKEGAQRHFNDEEMAYLFWYLMNPHAIDYQDMKNTLNLPDVRDLKKRFKNIRERACAYNIVVPEAQDVGDPTLPLAEDHRLRTWDKEPLGPNPEIPHSSKINKKNERGTRTLTNEEKRYMSWYVINSEKLLDADKEEIAKVLDMSQKEVGKKIAKLRWALKNKKTVV